MQKEVYKHGHHWCYRATKKHSYVQTQALQGRVSLELFMSKDKVTIHF